MIIPALIAAMRPALVQPVPPLEPGMEVFTSSGTFNVPVGVTAVDVLVVAGGGGGGSRQGGGGGAGGVVVATVPVTPSDSITVTVGAGGAGGTSGGRGSNGSNSSFGSLLEAEGGGGGGGRTTNQSGADGGSGGGGAARTVGGAGTQGQGFAGGSAVPATLDNVGGGGGGASEVGADSEGGDGTGIGGKGGDGFTLSDLGFGGAVSEGAPAAVGGGGGGGVSASGTGAVGGEGGLGGGGAGADAGPQAAGTAGAANTGGGGGGSNVDAQPGGAGGSGLVVVMWPGGRTPPTINALRGVTVDPNTFNTLYEKSHTTQQAPASLIKMMTAIIVREWILDGDLDDTVTIVSSDIVNPVSNTWMQLQNGDVLSYRDLLYGLMLPSGNDAALALSRLIGGMILVSEGGVDTNASANRARFVDEMNARATDLGLSDTTFTDSIGIAFGNRSTPLDIAMLMHEMASDSVLRTIAGTYTRTITITGANARTYDVTHTIDPSGEAITFPEFICGKTGTVTFPSNPEESSGGCRAFLWQSPLGVERISVVMGAAPGEETRSSMRRLIDYELARLGEL